MYTSLVDHESNRLIYQPEQTHSYLRIFKIVEVRPKLPTAGISSGSAQHLNAN